MKRLYILAFLLILTLATSLSVGAQSQRPEAPGGDVLTSGKTYTFFCYSKLAGQMIRTSWDGSIYSPGVGTNPFTVALTAQANGDGTWSFYYDNEVTTTVDDVTMTETVRYYMNLPQGTGNVNIKAEERCDWIITPGHYNGFYFVKPGAGNNTAALGYNMHMNAGNEYVVVSYYGNSWYPDFFGGVLKDEKGENVYLSDDPRENRVVMADSSSCNWAFVEVDNVQTFLEKCQKANLSILEGASHDNPVDATSFLINANFDQGNIDGWDITGDIGQKLQYNYNAGVHDYTLPDGTPIHGHYNSYTGAWIDGFVEAWLPTPGKLGNGSFSQTIKGLPAGKYSFECDALACNQSKDKQENVGVYLFAEGGGVSAKKVISTANERPEHFKLDFISGGGDITLGLMILNADANWMGADNFKLWYCGAAADPEPYAVLSSNNTVLTFYYDNQKEARGGMSVGPFNNSNERGWDNVYSAITSVVFDDSFADYTELTSTRYWFWGCRNLTSITGITNLKTENVTDLGCMFFGCSGLMSLDVSGFKTDNVKYMDLLFFNCSGLTSLDVRNFNTDNVIDMGCMFSGCSGLKSLDVSNFMTNNVTRMDYMFQNCSGLTSLDLSSFQTDRVTEMLYMFSGCSGLTTIYVGDGWSTSKVTKSEQMFTGCTKLVGAKGTTYNANHTDATYAHIDGGTSNPGYLTGKNATANPEPYAVLSSNNTVLTFYYDNQKTTRGGMSVGPFTSNSNRGWDGASGTIKSLIFDASFANCTTLTSTAWWFCDFDQLTSITGISNLKTSNVTNMEGMFSGCSGLSSLNLSGFNTSNVTSMSEMFMNCSGLTNLDVSGFNTKNVTDMKNLFCGCSSLSSLNLSGFNTSKVKSMFSMFDGCSSLTSLDVSNFNTSNVTDMRYMFLSCSSLTSLDVKGFNTSNVTDMFGMFYGCSSLKSLDVSSFNTSNVTYMGSMFRACAGLTSLDLSNFNTSNVTNMNRMFYGCSNLQTILVGSYWSIAKVSDSNNMFYQCTKLVGGKGTTYDANHIDVVYAHVDGGPTNPGYFTGQNVTTVCETPTISREGTSNYVIMSCATAGASIYYTTNGTMPTENNTRYTGPVAVSKNCTIKAIAIKDGYESSSVATYNVNWFKVATPTFSYNNLKLTISTATEGATIYYTTDGSTPSTTNSKAQVYSAPISLSGNTTVKAIAVKADYTNSDVSTYNFVQNDVTCQAPQISRSGTSNSIVMSSATSGATIYYTTDNTSPTQTSTRYTGSITVDHNMTIRAIAMKDGMFNSAQSQFTVDWFKVATPAFSYSNLQLTISTATTGATIYYTTDGSNPLADLSKAIRYTTPIQLDADATIKAAAIKTDFNNSEVVTYTFVKANYTCKAPQIKRDGSSDRVTMAATDENAVIYYTTDGSVPTTSSTRYTGPVTMTYNCTVRAIATRSDLFASGVSEFSVDWLSLSTVSVTYNNGVLILSHPTSGAEIHYEIGGKDATKSSPLYTGPITLTDNREVRYVVYVSGFDPISGSYTPTDFTCAPVTMTYDGLNMELATTETNATIYYTTDGSNPTTSSAVYTGKTPLTGLCTVNAIAVKQYKNNSEVMKTPVTYFFDGTTVFLSESGRMEDALKWRGTEGLESLAIECQGQGALNTMDMSFLRTMRELKHLNMKEARFTNNTVPTGAFNGMNIVSVEFPATNITTMGNVFSGCKHLAAIIWNARVQMAPTAQAAGISNPNLLLYVDNKVYAPQQGVRNVIANGSAGSIVLTDEEGGSFYCPQAFQAQSISYTHIYSQTTGLNKECRGWETIALPFDVQTIRHEQVGMIAPFAANDATARAFWLAELGSSGFKRAAEIKAYTPYIISMPNNEVYGSSYILAGKVTFEAVNTMVPETDIKTASKGDHVFTPCFDVVEASSMVYAINKNDTHTNFAEGSVFMPNYRDVKPFEAYISVPSSAVAPRHIPIFEDLSNQITPLPLGGGRGEAQGEGIVFDLSGRKVTPHRGGDGGGLSQGVYIIDGKKVIIR